MALMTVRLLERDQEVAELAALLDACVGDEGHGHGRVAVISGEAGIGKTALVEHVIAHAPPGVRALWGACEALFAPRPLGPLFDIAQQFPPTIRALLDGEAQRATLFATVLEELRSLPSILVVEDLHWADEATLDFIKYLARRIVQTKTLLLLTYRGEELGRDHPLRLVMGELPTRAVTRLRLLPFSVGAVTTLAKQTARPAQDLYAATGGNPFFVTEILASDAADVAQVPLSVSDAVLARVARRSPEAQRLLEVVSVSPARIERWVVAALNAGEDASLDECLVAGLLSLEGQLLAFRHELARQAVEGALSPARRQALHTQVLNALMHGEGELASLARLAHHATQAADAKLVLRFAPAAAREAAARGARREAIAHYQIALRYADQMTPEQHAELLDELSEELFNTGRIEDAIQLGEEALALWRALDQPKKVGHDLTHLLILYTYTGNTPKAKRLALAAVELLEPLPPSHELARAYYSMARLNTLVSDNAQAVFWGERAIALAERFGDFRTVSATLYTMGVSEFCADKPGGRANLERSLAIALEHGFESQVAISYSGLAEISIKQRDYVAGFEYVQQGLAYCAERDLDFVSQGLRTNKAQACLDRGAWAAAEEGVTAILGIPYLALANRAMPLTVLGQVRTRRGDPGVETVLDELRDITLPTGEMHIISPMAAARAEWRWLQGDLAGCAAEAEVGVKIATPLGRPWYLGEVAIWLWRATGSTDVLDHVASPFALEMSGDWRAAADAWEQLGCPYEQALALLDGDETAQREALAIFERLGARPAAEITRQRLHVAGVRGLPRGPMRATQANPYGLTPRQLETLLLLAEGLHNHEIADRLSTTNKTVQHHVTAILAKLQARSRVEAVSIAHTAGLIPR
jgi:DNA-binding CsgD family transcriptional regulator/tetratricopeptide (TPR) repeat protein